jgi:micrococcal nuclease
MFHTNKTSVITVIFLITGLSVVSWSTLFHSNNVVASTDENCDPSYPDVCIAPPPPDLNCDDVPYKDIKVTGSDPHQFDREGDGVGCES